MKFRTQAEVLVHDKIQSETFDSGSQLGKILGNLLQGTVNDAKDAKGDLKDFINQNEDLQQQAIPDGLKKYFQKHEDDYTVSNFFQRKVNLSTYNYSF
ncbi:hypothetical protein [Legionella tucsonensis]|uniref:Uncharacterized protein n=1 Tax=Legionella tucsonensis TaxID=40335 RepID=A0A0W0ZYB0_9GAMM|nr:hypothetical protein [Legionella tucsonensis]KTD74077.1 hypothetical protein Ltuc_1924 [Legionella tucsonensis]